MIQEPAFKTPQKPEQPVISRVGVIGAGVMGSGVAQNLAQHGFQVVLIDHFEKALQGARQSMQQNLRFQKMMGKTGWETTLDWDLIRFSGQLEDVQHCDFIIENVTENWEIKKPIFEKLGEICPQHTIFAANTSAISITRIASVTGRADRVVGIHFMNPVPQKSMVELIRGYHTSQATLDTTADFLNRFGKKHVLVKDAPGFISNRVLMLTINEAIFLVHEGTSNPTDIDLVFKNCFGHSMGPLETADLIGLDTILHSLEVLLDAYQDPKFRPCPLLKQMVDAGLHGRKTGEGFFRHQ
ncbi:3-hydroxyacyl-CoA dehydrogenase family protein [Deinococcus roseus]|uniref:3-hydroxybutyryl-CoA dehydrogenase n=1 Tax=Deinococcus roseus TaxID=392414 RepID=A0ABQ2DDE9_9DEIO|nr:3-hydroxyacyl-CoA dehydrogenase NAD-binding domain-containing protein [Deinococcus roseus]GGJ52764.1 3-hydroxybutyryl-CoA dehydrogenase [Deinococcus roseus]